MNTLSHFIHDVPADQVEPALWEETWQHPGGAFLLSLMEEIGWQGGTIFQVRDEILRRKRELLNEADSPSQP